MAPGQSRLAVEVEDHPIEYADFEGLIPKGNYGAGAVIVWDRGQYTSYEPPEEGLKAGKLHVVIRGFKLHGEWILVRTKDDPKSWLILRKGVRDSRKGRDNEGAEAGPSTELPGEESILSGLTVQELRDGRDPGAEIREGLDRLGVPAVPFDPDRFGLMLAESDRRPFSDPGWIFEIKFDGYRALGMRDPRGRALLRSRNGEDMGVAFPEIVRALAALPYAGMILDGELIVLGETGRADFHQLQGRAAIRRLLDAQRAARDTPVTFQVFDLLAVEGLDLRGLPLIERKRWLRRIVPPAGPLRYTDHIVERGEEMHAAAAALQLEGIMAKKADSRYRTGRSPHWQKLVADRTHEFAVIGFTEMQGAGQKDSLGALQLAGIEPGGGFRYVGRVGTGFKERDRVQLRSRLEARARPEPVCEVPETEWSPGRGGGRPRSAPRSGATRWRTSNAATIWVEPELVVEVRYRSFTPAGVLRAASLVRLREDRRPQDCVLPAILIGQDTGAEAATAYRTESGAESGTEFKTRDLSEDAREHVAGRTQAKAEAEAEANAKSKAKAKAKAKATVSAETKASAKAKAKTRTEAEEEAAAVSERPDARQSRSATSRRPPQLRNLDKVFWPEDGLTKGDLIDYYKTVAPAMLPYLDDRPLVLTRFPNGIHGKSFYQKDAPEHALDSLRTISIYSAHSQREIAYFLCDDVEGLMYLANLATIPIHVWSSRASTIQNPDWCLLDIDPKDAPFEHVIRLALAFRELLEDVHLPSFVKTTGSSGLHVLVPLPPGCTYEQSRLLAQLLCGIIESRHPKIATTERHIPSRKGRVYLDALQNRHGQLLVAPYSVRPLPGAPVSAPLRWNEVNQELSPRAFTIRNMPERLARQHMDPLRDVLRVKVDLGEAMRRLDRLVSGE